MGAFIFGFILGGVVVGIVLTMTQWGQDLMTNIKANVK